MRGCVAIERGPLVYCFEQADQLGGARLDDLAIQLGGVLGERPVTLDGIGQTIEVTAQGVRLPPAPAAQADPPQAATSTASFDPAASFASEVTAICSGTTATAGRCAPGCPRALLARAADP